MGGARDHAVGVAPVHHQRAEVRDVEHDVAGTFERHPLVGAEPGVLHGKRLEELRRPRIDDVGRAEVEAERRGLRPNLRFDSEQRHVDDLSRDER